MHPNPTFRKTDPARSLAAARTKGFGTLCLNGDKLPLTAHLPFFLSADGKTLRTHLVRSNPVTQALNHGPRPALMSVLVLDAYISPDWYKADNQVPTWNYVAVRLEGTLGLLPDADLYDHLCELSDLFEKRLLPKPVWRLEKVSKDVLARRLRMIVPIELTITNLESTWKLAQNKDEAARLAAAGALLETSEDSDIAILADLMRYPPEPFD